MTDDTTPQPIGDDDQVPDGSGTDASGPSTDPETEEDTASGGAAEKPSDD